MTLCTSVGVAEGMLSCSLQRHGMQRSHTKQGAAHQSQGLPGLICEVVLQATAELYDEEGFMRTGDVCEQLGPDEFAWIDRVSNIIKMSQGEYVSVSRLEAIFAANSPSIHQMYLYGNSLRAHLVAIVVPNQGEEPSLHAIAFTLCLQHARAML